MRNVILLIAFTGLVFAGCHPNGPQKNCVVTHKYTRPINAVPDSNNSGYISTDSANKMIGSYLQSIGDNDTDLHSLIFNADSLRSYLANKNIINLKFMLGHTLNYINSGGQGQYAGYQAWALTLIIAGYDTAGNYVYYKAPSGTLMVKDHVSPCPNCCPTKGTAASDFLQPNR